MRESLPLAEARRHVLGRTPALAAETVAAREALGRVLAESIDSDRTLPPVDVSAMDGYAVRREDCAGALIDRPVILELAGEIAAGGQPPATSLSPGAATRIFTGAPVPPGADAVVRQEDTRADGGRVEIYVAPEMREHVRDAGEDIRAGDRVLEAGCVVGPPELGLLASLGRSVVAVHRRPRVAILSGGDELVEPDRPADRGQIVSSNSYALAGQCLEAGAEPIYLGIARDDPGDLRTRLRAGLHADCLVSSAGVSVGDHDHVRSVLADLGCELEIFGVRIKPGFPMAFGRLRGRELPLIFGLPGNPVSAMVTFEQFVRPALRRMQGHRVLTRPVVRARVGEKLQKTAGRAHLVRVRLEYRNGEYQATPTGNQSSGVLRSMSAADGLLLFPEEATEIKAGAFADVEVLDLDVLARAPSAGGSPE